MKTARDDPGCLCISCCLISLELECTCVELVVCTLVGDELVVVTSLDDPAVVKYHDDIGVHDGGETVCDNEYRSAFHELIHTLLNDGLRSGIDRGCSLVEDHYRRIRYCGSRDGDELSLTL